MATGLPGGRRVYARAHRRAASTEPDRRARRRPRPPGAAVRLRQARHRRLRARPGRPRHRAGLHRRHGAGAARGRACDVRAIEDFTGFPEIMDGRVKTLHPQALRRAAGRARRPGAHGGGRRARDRVRRPRVREPLPVRAHGRAARRGRRRGDREHRHRRPDDDPRGGQEPRVHGGRASSPESYDAVLDELREADGALSLATREALAAEAFAYTARYDTADRALVRREARRTSRRCSCAPSRRSSTCPTARTRTSAPPTTSRSARACTCCRWCSSTTASRSPTTTCLDLDSARALVAEFEVPACAIVKHNNPCGAALGADVAEAYQRAFACDPLSAFGGIDRAQPPGRRGGRPQALSEQFVEVAVRARLRRGRARDPHAQKPNMRILEDERAARPAAASPSHAGRRRPARPGPRQRARRPRGDGGRHRPGPDRAGVGGPALRLARVPAREVQRDRAGAGPGDGRASAPGR